MQPRSTRRPALLATLFALASALPAAAAAQTVSQSNGVIYTTPSVLSR